ncbi:MAG: hypothetical protein EKK41_12735 [Hyphomicrobiales bacterium]|nr:MAG: hypothetical protein EKK41_12735 [Hyphomicrobiales bacterium]
MRQSGDSQQLAQISFPSKEELEREIADVAALSPLAAIGPELRNTVIVAMACGVAGWAFEWLFRPWLPPSEAPFGFPPLASIVFTAGIGALAAIIVGVAIVSFARMLKSGRVTVEVTGNVHATMPVWWVRGLLTAATIAAVFLVGGVIWLLGVAVRDGLAASANQLATNIGQYLGMTVFVSLFGGFLTVIARIITKYAKGLRLRLLASDRLWLVRCAFEAALYGGSFFMGLMGIAAVVEPLFAATILGSTVTPATFASTALLGAWGGFIMLRSEWRDRATTRMQERIDRPMEYVNDFRTWTIETETSLKKTTPDGYPLFMWRESADDRLGLSRPRYCCVVREGDELVFHFFDPVGARKSTGTLAAACLAGGAAALWTLAEYFVLGHTTTAATRPFPTPPALIFLNAGLRAAIIGGLIASAWYVVSTLVRWGRNRFENDGALYKWPWRDLHNFRALSAADAGAMVNGEPAKSGEGLAAILTDGTQVVLTANAWTHTTIASYHTTMSKMFVIEREAMMLKFAAQLKAEQRARSSGGAGDLDDDSPSSL